MRLSQRLSCAGATTYLRMIESMNIKQAPKGFYLLMAALISSVTLGQESSPKKREIKLTGIVLASDARCSEAHTPMDSDGLCRSSDWALASGRITYLLYGDKAALRRFERQRVSITGLLDEEPIVEYGTQMIRRKIELRSIESSELSRDAIEVLVNQLKVVPWRGPENYCSPMCWDFAFTDPMVQILQAGRGAQEILLAHMGDQAIQDQVAALLGGVGDEKSIRPIIETLTDGDESTFDVRSKHLNLIGNLALTNLTVSEVIWHHGGGFTIPHCPTTPKSCWVKWWLDQRDTFKVGSGGFRLYSNYPNYGIYEQFADSSYK